MPRWEPGSTQRMQAAALDLFAEQGFDRTTVTEIAARAGVTRRTFFRQFADKREVLFSTSVTNPPETALVEALAHTDGDLAPLQMIMSAIAGYDWDALAPRPFQLRRNAVIQANPELAERDLIKHEAVARSIAEALHRRGVDAGVARLAADVGIAVFRTAYDRWLATEDAPIGPILDDVITTLATAAGRSPAR
jgi:AcrR family transcriptional regulator